MELRNHQEECIEKIEENFITNKKGLIKMFCGSGKSLIIYHSLLKYCKNLAVLVVPSINLITQFNNDYMLNPIVKEFNKKHFNKNFNLMSICSKDELEKQDGANLITTDKYEIYKFINTSNEKILLVTYQSLPNLIDIIKDNNIIIDILCFDEAHHILGDNISNLLFSNKNINFKGGNFIDNHANKTLFFTATPKNTKDYKMFNNLTEITINDQEYDIIDNDNVDNYDMPICGPLLYEYTHLNGVSDDILNDFNIRIELYSENTKSTTFETISRAILETGNNRVLTFHSRSSKKSDKSSDVVSFSSKENQDIFKKSFYKVLNNEFPGLVNKYKKLNLKGITAQTKCKTSILNEFDKTKDDEIYILSSCKTIGEGVDTKNANMVCFIDPKQSYIEIIQNIGRICRKNKNTSAVSTVLVPCYVDINKYNKCDDTDKIDDVIRNGMADVGDFNGILSVLSALRQEDPYMFELCLKYPNTYTNDEFKRQFKRFNLILDDTEYTIADLFNTYNIEYNNEHDFNDNFTNLSDNLNKNVKIFCKKIDEKNIRINNKYELDECFLKTENDTYIKVLGRKERNTKVSRPNRNIKPHVHTDDKIKVLWNIDNTLEFDPNKKVFGCFIKAIVVANKEELWLEMYNNIIKDDVNNMHKYSSWISKNKQKYKTKSGLFNKPNIKNLWETIKDHEIKGKFFYSKEETWFMKLEDFKLYLLSSDYKIDKENYNVSNYLINGGNKYTQMGYWIDRNVKNYRNNKSLMTNEDIKQQWVSFMYDPLYYEEFKFYIYTSEYNVNKWKNYLNLIINSDKILKMVDITNKNWCDANLTIEEQNAFWLLNSKNGWIENNNRLFENKAEIMESIEIYELWSKFKSTIVLEYKHVDCKQLIINENKKIDESNKKWLEDFNIFKDWLDIQEERHNINDFKLYDSYIYIQNRMTYYNSAENKYKIDKWLELISNDKYKKFCLSFEDNFYFNMNILKKHYDKQVSLTNEELKCMRNWDLKCITLYKKKQEEMSNENIRTDYSKFAIQYKNIDDFCGYRYDKCGQKKLEKQLNKH
jgi:hypothetical protein